MTNDVAREPGSGRSERRARGALGAVAVLLVAVAAWTDLPAASEGEFWGDGATYYAMAWSLARDLDVRYEPRDLARVRREYPRGPQGLFAKRASGGLTLDSQASFPWVRRVRPEEGRLYYAKGVAYPAAAAPLVALFGTRGLLMTNALALATTLWLGYGVLRRRGLSAGPSLLTVAALLFGTVTPLYLFWPTPELLGLCLVTAGLSAWLSGRPVLSAVLFGLAGYVKWPNLLMAAPLGFGPLVAGWNEGRWRGALVGFRESLRRGAVLGVSILGLLAMNVALTGEVNYQGGERKTFYDRFPFDEQGTTFDDAGQWMTTESLGPVVGEQDDEGTSERTGPARAPVEIWESLVWNLGYFWTGRFGGMIGYFGTALVALVLFVLVGPRSRDGALALSAILLSAFAYLWIIPDNWYGGGGTVGNRYFLNILPAFLFLVPRGRERWVAAGGLALAAIFLLPLLVSPVRHSRRPGDHATAGPFKVLPAELTMLNDLSVFTESWRKKRPFGFVGNPSRHADPDAYNLYFMDDGTWGKEEYAGRAGFWLRAGSTTEVVVRAFDLAPVRRIVLELTGGPLGDALSVRRGLWTERLSVGPGQTREVAVPVGRGVRYYDTFLHVLHLSSRRGAPLADGRPVGAFVVIRLEMGPPFPGSAVP